MTTSCINLKIPQWFIDKYPYLVTRNMEECDLSFQTFPISTHHEIKFYDDWNKNDIFVDIQRIMKEYNYGYSPDEIDVVLLHECGGVSRISISKESIIGTEPVVWKKTESSEHGYHCSYKQEITH